MNFWSGCVKRIKWWKNKGKINKIIPNLVGKTLRKCEVCGGGCGSFERVVKKDKSGGKIKEYW